MKAKLVIVFAAVFCLSFLIAESSFAGANENATVSIKLLRNSQVATWTSSTASADSLLDIAEGESFWVKVYAQNVTDLFGWQVEITVNPTYLEYDPTSASNYKISTSAAGEKNILIKNDASGITTSDIIEINDFYDGTGQIQLAWALNSSTVNSSPALASDTGFVASVKLTAKTGVTIGNQDIIRATKILLTDVTGVTDAVSALDSGSVTFTPVELSAFSSVVIGGKEVRLDWVTTSETNNYGFYVQRSEDGVTFESIEFIEGSGTTTEEVMYSYTDISVNTGTYYYRLKFVAYDGTIAYSDMLEAAIGVPAEYSLAQNYPNPFNPSTTIKFTMKEAGFVELKVYNVVGQLIETLVGREMNAGYHSINFDASKIASGVYFYSIKAGNYQDIKKMVVVK